MRYFAPLEFKIFHQSQERETLTFLVAFLLPLLLGKEISGASDSQLSEQLVYGFLRSGRALH